MLWGARSSTLPRYVPGHTFVDVDVIENKHETVPVQHTEGGIQTQTVGSSTLSLPASQNSAHQNQMIHSSLTVNRDRIQRNINVQVVQAISEVVSRLPANTITNEKKVDVMEIPKPNMVTLANEANNNVPNPITETVGNMGGSGVISILSSLLSQKANDALDSFARPTIVLVVVILLLCGLVAFAIFHLYMKISRLKLKPAGGLSSTTVFAAHANVNDAVANLRQQAYQTAHAKGRATNTHVKIAHLARIAEVSEQE